MTEVVMIYDLVEENGKTVRENNLAISHNIPLGTLVGVDISTWYGNGACIAGKARLWVVRHDRDCDGTPLYTISRWKMRPFPGFPLVDVRPGFPEDALTPIEITEAIKDGYDMPDWWEEPA